MASRLDAAPSEAPDPGRLSTQHRTTRNRELAVIETSSSLPLFAIRDVNRRPRALPGALSLPVRFTTVGRGDSGAPNGVRIGEDGRSSRFRESAAYRTLVGNGGGEMAGAAVIRSVRVEDVAALEAVRRQPGVLDGTLNIPSERRLDRQRRIESLGPDVHELVAEVDGQVVGTAGLIAFQGRMSHAGEIAHIMVDDEFQGLGIGRQLMEALLDIADNYLGLVRVELVVYADNQGAVRLYESLGFAREGVKRKYARRRGRLVDAVMMARIREGDGGA
jgi:putative acetyltransferase